MLPRYKILHLCFLLNTTDNANMGFNITIEIAGDTNTADTTNTTDEKKRNGERTCDYFFDHRRRYSVCSSGYIFSCIVPDDRCSISMTMTMTSTDCYLLDVWETRSKPFPRTSAGWSRDTTWGYWRLWAEIARCRDGLAYVSGGDFIKWGRFCA